MGDYVCPICGAKEDRYIGHRNGTPYCRRCISFKGRKAEGISRRQKNVVIHLDYHLSRQQEELSKAILDNFVSGLDTLVYAVCGAGKTELSYRVISYAVSMGMNVGFALPRRDVVIELYARLKDAFRELKVVAVYGGHDKEIEGDIVILTTHQLYRYENYFDLLVMDEIDAFPFEGDEMLHHFFEKSLRGHYVMMSATASKEQIEEHHKEGKAVVELKTRFHKKPIPVPRAVELPGKAKLFHLVKLLLRYQKEKKPCLVFVPSVDMSESLYRQVSFFVRKGNYVSSKKVDRPEVISDFKKGKYMYLVTTAVLERGVTVKNLQVVVYGADQAIYDEAALIQIAGRAGRKMDAPSGEVTFLCDKVTRAIQGSIEEIRACNKHLQGLFQGCKAEGILPAVV